ncbi:hypothetical protein DFH09DRAFT_1372332 [Mycena vulgaris]|nr:hypothetical protein DFH09DRAFT_1372332 [Mycena vulgaris]
MPDSEPDAYGFVDPDEVIRGSHLIPVFAHGPTDPLPYTSLARKGDKFDDWRYHYVNFFVDRDMFMRYLGGRVGHFEVKVPDKEPDEPELPNDEEPDLTQVLPAEVVVPDPDSDPDSDSEDDEPDTKEGSDDDPDDEEEEEEEDPDEEEVGDFGPEGGEDGADDLAAQLGYDEL